MDSEQTERLPHLVVWLTPVSNCLTGTQEKAVLIRWNTPPEYTSFLLHVFAFKIFSNCYTYLLIFICPVLSAVWLECVFFSQLWSEYAFRNRHCMGRHQWAKASVCKAAEGIFMLQTVKYPRPIENYSSLCLVTKEAHTNTCRQVDIC